MLNRVGELSPLHTNGIKVSTHPILYLHDSTPHRNPQIRAWYDGKSLGMGKSLTLQGSLGDLVGGPTSRFLPFVKTRTLHYVSPTNRLQGDQSNKTVNLCGDLLLSSTYHKSKSRVVASKVRLVGH